MKKTLIALTVATMLVVPGLALAGDAVYQQVGTKNGDNRYFGDEPDVTTANCLAYAPPTDPSRCFPADSNGIAAALAGGDPVKVLNSKWLNRAYGPSHKSFYFDTPGLLADFDRGRHMFGAGQLVAWYGFWTDLNGDGFLTDASWEAARGSTVYVQVGDERDCVGNVANAPGLHVSALGSACGQADEWAPVGAAWMDHKIFSYITPARMQDMVNGCCPANPVLGAGPGPREQEPDTGYIAVGTDLANAEEGGKYYAPEANFDFAFNDNSLLETTVVETLVNPKLTVDQPRIYNQADGEPTDVDIYVALDPVVEGLYQTSVLPVVTLFVDPDDPDSAVGLGGNPLSPVIGPLMAPVFPGYEVEDTGFDHAGGYNFYLDARLEQSTYLYTVLVAGQGSAGGVDPTASGANKGGVVRMVVGGFLGAWFDRNGDGWIGDGTAGTGPGCTTDPYDCGARQDPNSYTLVGSVAGGGVEFVPVCRTPAHVGTILATLTSSTDSWGPLGAYVFTDREDYVFDPGSDRYAADGRAMFNPFDDIADDVINNGGLSLVTSGPIELHLVCTNPQGQYFSYEEVWISAAARTFDIILATEEFAMTKVDLGIEDAQAVSDTDVYAA